MKRIRVVKQYGGSHLIALEPADLKDYKLKAGSEVIIDDIIKVDEENIKKEVNNNGKPF